MCARPRRELAAALAAAALLAHAARAESALHLDYPVNFGTIPAATYDDHRQRVGAAHLVIERTDAGRVRVFSESGLADGARTVASAELVPQDGERWLRLEVEESRTFGADGRTTAGVESRRLALPHAGYTLARAFATARVAPRVVTTLEYELR